MFRVPRDDTPGIQPKFAVSTLGPKQLTSSWGTLALLLERITCMCPSIGGTARTHYELYQRPCRIRLHPVWIAAGPGLMRVADLPWKSEGTRRALHVVLRCSSTNTFQNTRCLFVLCTSTHYPFTIQKGTHPACAVAGSST